MTRYTVTWQPEAKEELARLWVDDARRDQIAKAADQIDVELVIDPFTRGGRGSRRSSTHHHPADLGSVPNRGPRSKGCCVIGSPATLVRRPQRDGRLNLPQVLDALLPNLDRARLVLKDLERNPTLVVDLRERGYDRPVLDVAHAGA